MPSLSHLNPTSINSQPLLAHQMPPQSNQSTTRNLVQPSAIIKAARAVEAPKSSSSALMSDRRINELRLSHQVEKMAENQKTMLNLIKINNNSVPAPKAKTSTGHNAKMMLFNTIFREKLIENFSEEAINDLAYFLRNKAKIMAKIIRKKKII